MDNDKRFQTQDWDTDAVHQRIINEVEAASAPAPKKKRRKGKFNWKIYVAAVVLGSMLLAGIGWILANDLCALDKGDETYTVTIEEGDGVFKIASKLKKAGIIKYKLLFVITSPLFHAKDTIQPGSYELNTDMDYNCIIDSMQQGSSVAETVKVTIPEGYSVQETIQLLADSDVSNVEDLTEAAKNHVFDYTFVDNENLGSITRLEGFLFPDTYEFFHKEDAVSALDRLLSNFQNRVSGDLLTDIENSQYSLREIVTLASIIEKEAIGDDEERANISSVFYNRLSGDNSEIGTALQSDATIYYALHIAGMDDTQFSTDLDSPYNTYKYGGLPAGPICNPSLSSIKAAVHPNDTGYYYFAYGKDGVSHFFRTYDEHLAFVNSDMYAPD